MSAKTYQQKDGFHAEEVAGEIFLVSNEDADLSAANNSIYHLDQIGAALWRLLAVPVTMGDILAIFTAAFPDIDANQLEQDVARILTSLEDAGFITVT